MKTEDKSTRRIKQSKKNIFRNKQYEYYMYDYMISKSTFKYTSRSIIFITKQSFVIKIKYPYSSAATIIVIIFIIYFNFTRIG